MSKPPTLYFKHHFDLFQAEDFVGISLPKIGNIATMIEFKPTANTGLVSTKKKQNYQSMNIDNIMIKQK